MLCLIGGGGGGGAKILISPPLLVTLKTQINESLSSIIQVNIDETRKTKQMKYYKFNEPFNKRLIRGGGGGQVCTFYWSHLCLRD